MNLLWGGLVKSSYYGPTKNAWDQRCLEESSSGSQQLLSLHRNRVPGSDTGGSIRQPPLLTGLLVSNQLMERCSPVLVSLLLVVSLTKLDLGTNGYEKAQLLNVIGQ